MSSKKSKDVAKGAAIGAAAGAHIKKTGGIIRDDIRRIAAICNNPMNSGFISELLAQQPNI